MAASLAGLRVRPKGRYIAIVTVAGVDLFRVFDALQREVAEAGNPLHVGTPMPSAMVTVPVAAGQ